MTRLAPFLLGLVGSLLAGCSSRVTSPPSTGVDAPTREPSLLEPAPISSLHLSKCGSCHRTVEPGSRSRAHLETALSRHHRRARLTDDQWAEMLDYLAADHGLRAKTAIR